MHSVETLALNQLPSKPKIYKRYIDDIIFGPISRDQDCDQILAVFNSINVSIQFTADIPATGEPLNFLDLAIFINNGRIDFTWYSKPCHSENTLRRDSWLPSYVKNNFLKNSVRNVAAKCSSADYRECALKRLKDRFVKNGFKNVDYNKILSKNENKSELNTDTKMYFQLQFLGDTYTKKINKLFRKYDFPVRPTFEPSKKLSQCLRPPTKRIKHDNCEICTKLPDNHNCNDRFLVYKFVCNICYEFYIGHTSRPFKKRFIEHRRSLEQKNFTSALSEHVLKNHADQVASIFSFDLQILRHCRNPIDSRLAEARLINLHRPKLNRKHEMIGL